MTDPLVEYASRAFGHSPEAMRFYLREVADPGEFDRTFAAELAKAKARPIEPLTPNEARALRRGIRRMRAKAEAARLQAKYEFGVRPRKGGSAKIEQGSCHQADNPCSLSAAGCHFNGKCHW